MAADRRPDRSGIPVIPPGRTRAGSVPFSSFEARASRARLRPVRRTGLRERPSVPGQRRETCITNFHRRTPPCAGLGSMGAAARVPIPEVARRRRCRAAIPPGARFRSGGTADGTCRLDNAPGTAAGEAPRIRCVGRGGNWGRVQVLRPRIFPLRSHRRAVNSKWQPEDGNPQAANRKRQTANGRACRRQRDGAGTASRLEGCIRLCAEG